jgi:hypothetical protein
MENPIPRMFDPTSINDPRINSGFEPACWPLCDGAEGPPPDSGDRTDLRKIQFLAVYYRLNQLYTSLHAIRSNESKENERPLLEQIQHAIHKRDELENFYEPEGFLGEPVMDGFFYRNIEFTYARRREFYEPAPSSSFSIFMPLPPAGADIESWVRENLAKIFPAAGSNPAKP